ncbi:oligosaccharyl transferase [Aureococcus anophagefferens]|nr:oligosaccharyl transferase [Aureococcus anophagefferens]
MSLPLKLLSFAKWAAWVATVAYAVSLAYAIRLKAIHAYGYVIHEFDPWFNMRATTYLADHGLYEFFHWFDRLSWYPLGRPVGTTIYPGMQMTAVGLWRLLGRARAAGLLTWWKHVRRAPISLNDVCCLVPAWFGGSATTFLALLTLECTNSYAASGFAGLIMAIVPAHLMRSVGGGYDNESIALTAILFFFIGTAGAVQVPVVGWRPVRDLELLPPLLVFVGLQFYGWADGERRARGLGPGGFLLALIKAGIVLALLLGAAGAPASTQAYEQYLHHVYRLAPFGLGLSFLRFSDAGVFLWVYAAAAYFFANKMARLIILLGPVAAALGGVALGAAADHGFVFALDAVVERCFGAAEAPAAPAEPADPKDKKAKRAARKPTARMAAAARRAAGAARTAYRHPAICLIRAAALAYAAKTYALPMAREFQAYCEELSEGLSQPSIMFKARLRSGEEIIVDDYREAYWWLRDNTPKDARILAWWDYGYQITGIGERTTLADGNTWNHEHIATLGRILTAPEAEAHKIAKHLADYVLVWAGGGGDDLAKSPHMARIGNSIYHDFCPDDPTCQHFGFYQGGRPTPSMAKSLLYKLTTYGGDGRGGQGTYLNTSRWEPAYTTKYGKVRIFKIKKVSQKSKNWVKNATNLLCDAPGSWYCPGQYPPAIKWLIDKRKPFRQLEDFNTGAMSAEEQKYNEEYHKRMAGDKSQPAGPPPPRDGAKPTSLAHVGCYRLESQLPADKVYGGGDTGASISAAVNLAMAEKKRYVALAKVGDDGHSFVFDDKPTGATLPPDSPGCGRPCADSGDFYCGCADAGCDGVARQSDEEYLRRWVVYDLGAAGKKNKKAKKSEL